MDSETTGPPSDGRGDGDASSAPLAANDPSRADADLADAVGSEDDLRVSLTALSQLATSQMRLSDVLTRVAEFSVLAIPEADGAGLTLMERARHDTVVASAPFVGQVDAIQYRISEGPCITAVVGDQTVRSGQLGTDPRWPRFGRRVARLGVHSALCVPLRSGGAVLGAMNIYARQRDAFDDRAAVIGELFAIPAAIAVQNAQVLDQTRRLASQLQTALTNRATIDQALGIVMSRVGCTPDEAFDRLRGISQAESRKLSDVARDLVAEAVRRARARHANPSSDVN